MWQPESGTIHGLGLPPLRLVSDRGWAGVSLGCSLPLLGLLALRYIAAAVALGCCCCCWRAATPWAAYLVTRPNQRNSAGSARPGPGTAHARDVPGQRARSLSAPATPRSPPVALLGCSDFLLEFFTKSALWQAVTLA